MWWLLWFTADDIDVAMMVMMMLFMMMMMMMMMLMTVMVMVMVMATMVSLTGAMRVAVMMLSWVPAPMTDVLVPSMVNAVMDCVDDAGGHLDVADIDGDGCHDPRCTLVAAFADLCERIRTNLGALAGLPVVVPGRHVHACHRQASPSGHSGGLLVELNPLEAEDAGELPCGEFRQLLLFDALESAALKVWLEKLNSASAHARQSPTEFGALPGAVPFDVSPGGYQSPQRGRFFQSGANENNAFDIDDFSDYEDDRHARESSLPALDEKDWTSPTNHPKSRPRRRSDSREDLGEAKPRESGATAENGEGATQAPSACVEVACPEAP
ncbi:Psmd10, partial [Symbiodinium microadriaticum]